MCSACITISPAASKTAAEQSRRSLMFAEWAERIRTAPISSQAEARAPATIWISTGSGDAHGDRAQSHRFSSIEPSGW